MPSSISSSNARLPKLRWAVVLGGAAATCVLFVALLELRLGLRGFQPTASDSEALWIGQRLRASELGERALILVGSSRIQLDADLEVLRSHTGLEPVQLAIDGSSFRPVLAGLAADDSIRGTVVVDFSDHLLTYQDERERSYAWQAAYEQARGRLALPDFERTERWLTDAWRRRLRSYADGARPLTSVVARLLPAQPVRQYLVTRQDRSRLADYSKVDMPLFYFARVLRNLGSDAPEVEGLPFAEVERLLAARIESLPPHTQAVETYLQSARELAAQAAAIQARGGRVLFAMLPKSGLVRALDDRRFPRPQFWDRFAREVRAPALHFDDVPAWRDLQCPDGSHLDFRQRRAFSVALAEAIARSR